MLIFTLANVAGCHAVSKLSQITVFILESWLTLCIKLRGSSAELSVGRPLGALIVARNSELAMVIQDRAIGAALTLVLISLVAIQPTSAQQGLVILNDRAPAPSLSGAGEWLNTEGPLDLPELRGKFVILDFWTYCCINCMHVLPELKKLEEEFPQHLVVIGVHSPKFAAERDPRNVMRAIERYEVKHPVVCDSQQSLWNKYRVSVWPSLRVIDPEGNLIATHQGEFKAETLAAFLRKAIPVYRRSKSLDESPLAFDVAKPKPEDKPLRYPGKVLADSESGRLFVADSGHNRIVVAKLTGEVLDVIGSGAIGRTDGAYEQATFNHPQGMALHGDTLYVADTENHSLRKVDLKQRKVITIAGTGEQGREPVMRAVQRPLGVKLASPWDLWLQGDDLFIAMAGMHQIWIMSLDSGSIGPFAGNFAEDIVDGPLLPRTAGLPGYASFAQPSGLASDGANLFVADSEGSSIRSVPIRSGKSVSTLLGTAALPQQQRLFTFGDRDGALGQALLQHPLGVVFRRNKIYIADTYNSKIKEFDLQQGTVRTIAGGGMGAANGLLEPGGLGLAGDQLFIADTNHHLLKVIDISQDSPLRTVELRGLKPSQVASQVVAAPAPTGKRTPFKPSAIKPNGEVLELALDLQFPVNFKLSPDAPLRYYVHSEKEALVATAATGKWHEMAAPQSSPVTIELPLQAKTGAGPLTITFGYYYCSTGNAGICKVGEITWTGRITLDDAAPLGKLELKQVIGK